MNQDEFEFKTRRTNRNRRLKELKRLIEKKKFLIATKKTDKLSLTQLQESLRENEQEAKQLNISLISDARLLSLIKQLSEKVIKESKIDDDLASLNELEYNRRFDSLIGNLSTTVYYFLTNKGYDKTLKGKNKELNKIICDRIYYYLQSGFETQEIKSNRNDSKSNSMKRTKQTPHSKNYDKEIGKYIEAYLRFYRKSTNHEKELSHKYLAKAIGFSGSTLSRRFNEEAESFLTRFKTSIAEILNPKFKSTVDIKITSESDKEILIKLNHEIELKHSELTNKTYLLEKQKELNIKPGKDKDGKEIPRQFPVPENEELIIESNVDRTCDNCRKKYKVTITEDNDPEKWEKAAKNDPTFYRKLVCSDECYSELLKKKEIKS